MSSKPDSNERLLGGAPDAPEVPVIDPAADRRTLPEVLVPADGPADGDGRATDVEAAKSLRVIARREHELLALSELSQELTISLDLYAFADLVLFNLMGQLGTSRAAIWLLPSPSHKNPILLRSHGIENSLAVALGNASAPWLLPRLKDEKRLVVASEVGANTDASVAWLIRQEGVALFAPILSRGDLLGFFAVGPRVDRTPYGPVELQTLQTSLGMVGVALQNTQLYGSLLETIRQLRVANDGLKELDVAKSEFLRNVNHELRTPLTIVIASLQCVLDQPEVDTQRRELLGAAHQKAKQLKGLLENLLAYSAATQGQLDIRFEAGSVLPALATYFQSRLPGVTQGLREFTLDVAPDLPPVRFDRQRLVQIVEAIVDNAVKFTRPGAHITLRISRTDEGASPTVRVDVADDGPGIPDAAMATLFQPFRQVDGSMTREVGGMGLGLAFAKELAEKMDARLTVSSTVGRGSTFSLVLSPT